MQGSLAADGTAWAAENHGVAGAAAGGGGARIFGWEEGMHPREGGDADDEEHSRGQAHPSDTPALQDDRWPLWGEGAEFAEQVAGVAFHERAQLRRAGHPPGGGKRLGELIRV